MNMAQKHIGLTPHSFRNECKNEQKSVLKSVNVQRTGKSFFQMFSFSFFDGIHICRCLPILCPHRVPPSHFCPSQTALESLIYNNLYLHIVTSASESRFCVGK